jgi:hypothetical protein
LTPVEAGGSAPLVVLDRLTMRIQRVRDRPFATWLGIVDGTLPLHRAPLDLGDLMKLDRELAFCVFRAVNFDRISRVVATGADVVPTDSPIYADAFDKAWEYGGWPKLILAYASSAVERTFREVPANTPSEELRLLRERFPTVVASPDGTKLWLSRPAEDDRRLATPYEMAYGWWIPGDPFEALHAILVFARREDVDVVRAALDVS